MKQLLFPTNPQFWFETLRSMSHIAYGGADFGEVVSTAERITEGDYDSWHTEWLATADRVAAEAQRALDAGHPISARDGFLRASNYYRSAEFFLHGNPCDPRHDHAYDRSVACFRAAAPLCTPRIEPVAIPYEGTTLPGYLYRPDASGAPRPTLIMHSGFDGTAEELHFSGALAAAERGYTVLTFDGPGQPGPRHHQGLPFRPDWENVISPVIDFAEGLPEVDNSRIALLGSSMGGVLAPRAAAFEHRLAALIAVDGVFDLGAVSVRNIPGGREEAERRLRAPSDPELDAAFAELMTHDETARWANNHGMYVMGVDTPRAFGAAYLDYTVLGGVAERIQCPTLVCDAAEDEFFRGQPEELYAHLTCPKDLMLFTAEEGAGAHCHPGAMRLALARVYDWLDDVLARAV